MKSDITPETRTTATDSLDLFPFFIQHIMTFLEALQIRSSPISLRTALAAAALLPVVVPAVYLLHINRSVSKRTKTSSGRRSPPSKGQSTTTPDRALASTSPALPWTPASLPADVKDDDSEWVLAYERVVSHPLPASTLSLPVVGTATEDSPSELLRRYVAATHVAFSKTPQAFAIRASISEPHLRRSFDADVITDLAFRPGDHVNGAYKVTYYGQGEEPSSERVELTIEAPESYKGHVPKGMIVGDIQVIDGLDKGDGSTGRHVVFVNETWMWRRIDESATLIESAVGGWLHSVMAGWLIIKGIAGVSR